MRAYLFILMLCLATGHAPAQTADANGQATGCGAAFSPNPDPTDPMTIHFQDNSSGQITLWQWNFGDGATSTLQNPTIIYETAGVYDVSLTVSDGVDSHTVTFEDYITVNICTTIKEINIEKISIYPNPNSGIFTVKLNEDFGENVTIKLLNAMSSVVFERKNTDINSGFTMDLDLSNLNKGLYFLVIESYQGNTVQRIIIR